MIYVKCSLDLVLGQGQCLKCYGKKKGYKKHNANNQSVIFAQLINKKQIEYITLISPLSIK